MHTDIKHSRDFCSDVLMSRHNLFSLRERTKFLSYSSKNCQGWIEIGTSSGPKDILKF